MTPMNQVNTFEVGEKAILNGREVTIEQVSMNVNKIAIYKIGELWYKGKELEKWYTPCPV